MNASRRIYFYVVFALIVVAAGTFYSNAHRRSPYPVTRTNLLFAREIGFSTRLYWLDNDRLLFPGNETHETIVNGSGEHQVSISPVGIYILDTRSNTYERHADLKPEQNWFMCFNEGFLAYSIDGSLVAGEQKTIKAGQIGQEKVLPSDIFWADNPELKQCDRLPRLTFANGDGTERAELFPEDGYIVVGKDDGSGHWVNPGNQNDPVKLYKPGQAAPISVPVLAKEMNSAAEPSYSEYAGAYVLVPRTWRSRDIRMTGDSWPSTESEPVYLVARDGSVTIINTPPGHAGITAAFPTIAGLVWVANLFRGDSRSAGGWLLQGNRLIKLFDHLADTAAVSPDGCKLAFQSNDLNPKTLDFLQIIDFCGTSKDPT